MDEIPVICLDEERFVWQLNNCHMNYEDSYFDSSLKKSWLNAEQNGALNYDLNVKAKVIPGYHKIIVQLNPCRIAKRRKPGSFSSIKQPFDSTKFNFTLLKREEILFEIHLKMPHQKIDSCSEECYSEGKLTSTVTVNSSPITPYHSLIIPSRFQCKRQIINHQGLLLSISSILASNTPALKVGFNSLGGMASVNHYHHHIYYLPYPLFIETAKCKKETGPLYTFSDHLAPGFVFELENKNVEELVRNSMTLIRFLLEEELCHNVMISRAISTGKPRDQKLYDTVRVCIWIRKPSYGTKEIKGFASALCELSGHVPVYDNDFWETLKEEDVIKVMEDVCGEVYNNYLPKIIQLFS